MRKSADHWTLCGWMVSWSLVRERVLKTALCAEGWFGQSYLTVGSSFQESRASKFIRSPPYQGEIDRLAVHANVLQKLRHTCCNVIPYLSKQLFDFE